MTPQRVFPSYPARIRIRAEPQDLNYRILDGHYCVRGPLDAAQRARAVVVFDDENLAVCRGAPGDEMPGDAAGPVYALEPNGPPAVPTGRVLVRFAGGVRAESRAAALEAAGWRIELVLAYAPNAAWVRAASGRADDALRGLERLESLDGVVHVEPQLLTEAEPR